MAKPRIKIRCSEKPDGEKPITGFGTQVFLINEDGTETEIPEVKKVTITMWPERHVTASIEINMFDGDEFIEAILERVAVDHFDARIR